MNGIGALEGKKRINENKQINLASQNVYHCS
jgi:hypothetical protein